MSIGLTISITIISFILGTVFGSFMYCLAWRYVNHESVLKGRSHCAVCGHELGAADLVPVFSFIFLKGRCRYCHEKISPRYVIVELITGFLFAVTAVRFGAGFDTVRYMALICVLVGLSLIDLDTYEIPNGFIIAAIVIWIATVPVTSYPWKEELLYGAIGAFAIGGAILLISLLFDRMTGKESLGGGDIKLFFVAGLYLGLARGMLCIIVSCIVGLLFVALLKKKRIPFGPSISIALMMCILWGSYVVSWYMGLFQ